jgi:tetratricopeptide (TPR) repeat protein
MGKFLRLAILCWLVLPAASALHAQQEKTIWVEISDERGRPLANVSVRSQDWGKTVITTSSGKAGVPVSPRVRIGELVSMVVISSRYQTITGGPIGVRVAGFNQPSESSPITLVPKKNALFRINSTTAPARRPRPNDENDPFQKGKDALVAQRFDEALKHLLKSAEVRKRLYEKTPSKFSATRYADVNTELSLTYMILNKWNDAFERIQEAKRVAPTEVVKILFGVIAMTMGELQQAEPVLRELASSKGAGMGGPVGAMLVAEIYKMYGKLDESSRFEREFMRQLPKHELSDTKELNDLLKLIVEVTSDAQKNRWLRQVLRPVFLNSLAILHKAEISIIEKKWGPYSPELVQPLLRFSSSLQTSGRYDEAEQAINRAISVFKRLVGPSHIFMTQPLKKLADFEVERNRLDKAEALYRDIAEIFVQSLGPDNHWMDDIHADLASLHQLQDRPDEAEEKWQNIRKRNCSRNVDNVWCLRALSSLSSFYRDEQEYPEAIATGREAVSLAKRLWAAKDLAGTDFLLQIMGDLERVYKDANQQDEIVALQQERQEILALDVTPPKEETKEAELWLPGTMIVQLNGEQCRADSPHSFVLYPKSKLLLEAANRAARHLESPGRDVAELQYTLSLTYFHEGRFEETERLATGAITINEAALEPNRRTTSLLLGLRGNARTKRGNLIGAADDYTQALKILEILHTTSEQTLSYLFSLSKIQIAQQRYGEAEKNLKRALDIREKTFPYCSEPDSVTLVTDLAVLYVLTGRLTEAENNFKQALNALGNVLPSYPNSVYILENYAQCLRKMGKVDEAVKMEQEAAKLKPKKN